MYHQSPQGEVLEPRGLLFLHLSRLREADVHLRTSGEEKMKILLLCFFLSLPAFAQKWEKPNKNDWLVMGATQILIVADVGLSLHLRKIDGVSEANPLVGSKPSALTIILWGVAGEATYVGVWYSVPNPYRRMLSTVVLILEGYAVGHNVRLTVLTW